MPTYVYKREDGTTFEIEQRITAPALEACPTTGQKVRRVPSAGAGLVFKGSGFYLTDYVRKGGEEKREGGEKKDSGDAKASTGDAGSTASEATPSTPAPPPAPTGASTPGTPGAT